MSTGADPSRYATELGRNFAESDHYKAHFTSFEHRLIGSMPTDLISAHMEPNENVDPSTDHLLLQLFVDGRARVGVDYGHGAFEVRGTPGTMLLAPAHAYARYDVHAPTSLLMLPFKPSWIGEGRDQALDFGRLHAGCFSDRLVASILLRLKDEARRGDRASAMVVDQSILLIVALLWRASTDKARVSSSGARLSAHEMSEVRDAIEARIGENLTIDVLAKVVDRRPWTFLRGFRAAFGETPARFVLRRRMEKAGELLQARPAVSIIDIALRLGFADQAHFTTMFRRETGLTPHQWRQLRRG
jgi:AraC family transcriptional regulator